MRQVSKSVITAFLKGESKTVGNTSTNGVALFLHGNKIAKKDGNTLLISLCNWNTVTTRERLNSLLFLAPQHGYELQIKKIFQQRGEAHLWTVNENEWFPEMDFTQYYDAATLKGVLVS
jgi:hypothetical protein